jgi:hypothetical protein
MNLHQLVQATGVARADKFAIVVWERAVGLYAAGSRSGVRLRGSTNTAEAVWRLATRSSGGK